MKKFVYIIDFSADRFDDLESAREAYRFRIEHNIRVESLTVNLHGKPIIYRRSKANYIAIPL